MASRDTDYLDDFDDIGTDVVLDSAVSLDTTPLSENQARQLTDSIRNASEVLWMLIARAHSGKAWQALGYGTWGDYVKAEFDMSRSRSYQILDQARVIQAIEAAVPEGTPVSPISEAVARDLKDVLEEIVPTIRERTEGLPPEEAALVLEEIVDEQRERLREEREAAANAADAEDDFEYDGPYTGDGSGRRGGEEPPPVYDNLDDIDVSRIRRNVNAAHDIYSSLAALASLPEELGEVAQIIPEERHAQIDANLDRAIDNLARFAELWRGDDDEA